MDKNKNQTRLSVKYAIFAISLYTNISYAKHDSAGISLLPLPSIIPVIAPVEIPDKLTLSKAGADDKAKDKLNTADQLRNKLTNLTFSEDIRNAYNLYNEVANDADISPDLRGRAKINAAELYPYSNTDDSTYASIEQRKIESIATYNEVIDDKTTFSADLRSWAKRHAAKLYLNNAFDLDPHDAKLKALALLQEIIDDKDVSADTKAHAKIQMAAGYAHMQFDGTESDARQKATTALNEVKNDTQVTKPDIKAEAALGLANIRNSDDDPYNAQQLIALKAVSIDPTFSPSIQAKAKAMIVRGLLKGDFDSKPSEAVTMAQTLFKEIIAPPAVSAGAQANTKLEPAELFSYKQEYALMLANNAFHQKPKDAKDAAQALYTRLISDVSAFTEQKAAVKWQLALNYLEKKLDPPTGKDAKTAGTELINEILNDTHVGIETWLLVKLNFARLHHYSIANNPLSLPTSQAKDEALQLLNDTLNDTRLNGKQKEMVQAELDMWNGVQKS